MDSVLDNLERIKAIDKGGMCEIQKRLPENCEDAIKRTEDISIPKKVKVSEKITINYGRPKKIIVSGMGGSAIGGNLLKDWLRDRLPIPIEVCRDYHLPAYADEDTLVLVSSYSGNTEETTSALLESLERKCMVISISSDGVIQEFTQKIGIPFTKLPAGYPPRSAIPYLFFPLIVLLKKLGVIEDIDEEIEETMVVLKKVRDEVKPEIPVRENSAKRIALDIHGSIPLVYGFGFYEGVAFRIKTQFNENAKLPSYSAFFPELNHNETVGWTGKDGFTKNFTVLLIRDSSELPEIRTRIEVTRRLVFEGKARKVIEIHAKGKSKLAKMLSTVYTGDFASIYLAILNDTDPTPVKIIDELKKQLEDQVDKVKELRHKFKKITEG